MILLGKNIKLLNLTSIVYNLNNDGKKKSGIKTTYYGAKTCWQMITWSCKLCEAMNSRQGGTLALELRRHVDTLVHKYERHVDT